MDAFPDGGVQDGAGQITGLLQHRAGRRNLQPSGAGRLPAGRQAAPGTWRGSVHSRFVDSCLEHERDGAFRHVHPAGPVHLPFGMARMRFSCLIRVTANEKLIRLPKQNGPTWARMAARRPPPIRSSGPRDAFPRHIMNCR